LIRFIDPKSTKYIHSFIVSQESKFFLYRKFR
jgi:hypothetical protein